jgi:hypothetical protein
VEDGEKVRCWTPANKPKKTTYFESPGGHGVCREFGCSGGSRRNEPLRGREHDGEVTMRAYMYVLRAHGRQYENVG